jgi:hypothetical protein
MENRQKGKTVLAICILMIMTLWIQAFFGQEVALASDTEGVCGSDLSWGYADGVLEITGTGSMEDYGDNHFAPWYDLREEIQEIRLPDGLTSIGEFAFLGCTNVRSVYIPDTVEAIGSYGFAECERLQTIHLSSQLEQIGDSAFEGCTALEKMDLPDTVTYIGTKAFYRCESLTTITVPSSVTGMGVGVFAYCTSLVRATINASITLLPSWTFYGCTRLADVSLAAGIEKADGYVFQGCDSLSTIYTQSHDADVAEKIRESMETENENKGLDGLVAIYDMPTSSNVYTEDESSTTQIQVIETEGIIAVVYDQSQKTDESSKSSVSVSTIIGDSAGWSALKEISDKLADGNRTETPVINVQLYDQQNGADDLWTTPVVYGSDLSQFAEESVILNITTADDTVWSFHMENLSADEIKEDYQLGVTVSSVDTEKVGIDASAAYQIAFMDSVDLEATVGVYLSKEEAYQYGTLYQQSGSQLVKLQTAVIDADGRAWFDLSGVDTKTTYYVGINAVDVTLEEAVIPTSLYTQYGIEENNLTLLGDDGVTYQITGRTSSWGITGGKFAIYVAVAVGAVVLVVGMVMLTIYKSRQSKEKYARMAAEEGIAHGMVAAETTESGIIGNGTTAAKKAHTGPTGNESYSAGDEREKMSGKQNEAISSDLDEPIDEEKIRLEVLKELLEGK